MDLMLQLRGATQVSLFPPGLRDLVMDISREVIRYQPMDLYAFIADYLEAQLQVRDSAKEAVTVMEKVQDKALLIVNLRNQGTGADEAIQAATRIQAAYRSYVSRKMLAQEIRRNVLQPFGIDVATADKMANRIQVAYRKYVIQKTLAQKIGRNLPQYCGTDKATADNMASKIQTVYRAYAKRKQLENGGMLHETGNTYSASTT